MNTKQIEYHRLMVWCSIEHPVVIFFLYRIKIQDCLYIKNLNENKKKICRVFCFVLFGFKDIQQYHNEHVDMIVHYVNDYDLYDLIDDDDDDYE